MDAKDTRAIVPLVRVACTCLIIYLVAKPQPGGDVFGIPFYVVTLTMIAIAVIVFIVAGRL